SHPSLVLWCGNNENHQMYHDGWGGKRPPRFLGEALYHEVLPAVVEVEDPGRPYIPSSPYGGDSPNSQTHGDRHDWDVWHGIGDWVHYVEDNSRFSSEFGFASSCGMATWNACLAEMDRDPDSVAVRWHDKTRKGYETYQGYIQIHYPKPQTLEDLVYYSQINQADALKCGVEHWRRKKGQCWGTLIWQLNDCWPVQSWAMIDSEGEPKAAYYAAKRFYAPVLLSLVKNGEAVEAHLTSDLLQEVAGTVTLSLQTFEGERLAEETLHVKLAANCASPVAELPLDAAKGREREVFVYVEFTPDDERIGAVEPNFLLLAEPKDLLKPDPGIEIEVREQAGDVCLVTVTAKRFAWYVWLHLAGKPEWIGKIEWSDNFFHLPPGGSKELLLYTSGLLENPEEARTRLTYRCM
ncbi:MAG: hypothetical protein KY468_20345, partial [Armatimonadetes bacterium]|nr:hypothetical protein [Armatimonadota bacterium]